MRIAPTVVALVIAGSSVVCGAPARTYVGLITDTMCAADHLAMKVAPDAKCVRECVGDAKSFQYALLDGANVYRVSDQETPSQFAGRKVKVAGVLYPKTNILKVDRIEAVK